MYASVPPDVEEGSRQGSDPRNKQNDVRQHLTCSVCTLLICNRLRSFYLLSRPPRPRGPSGSR